MSIFGFLANKSDPLSADLKQQSLEAIDKHYAENNWLRIYTDGSAIPTTGHTGAGFFYSLLKVVLPSVNLVQTSMEKF